MPFYKFGCSYVRLQCTIFNMHNVHSVCFMIIDLRSLTCIIHMCYKCLARESKMASILNLIVCSSVGCPLNIKLFPHLKVVGCLLNCPLTCPQYPYMAIVGTLIYMANFPWAANGQPTPLPTELPTVSIYGSSGRQPNLHGKFPIDSPLRCPSAAHG